MTHSTRVFGCLVLSIAAAGGAVGQLSGAGASASAGANLSVAQYVSSGAAKNQTIITPHVHNAGPSTAPNVETVALVKTNSPTLSYFESTSGACEQQPAPPGWTYAFTCQGPSLASGHTWEPTITVTGKQGSTLTEFLSAADHGPADPSLANNASTLNTYVGAESDLGLSQKVISGASSGHATLKVTTRNHGPWTASSLQYVGEIKSADFKSVNATASTPAASCQFIPPAAGYNKAVSCVTSSLAPGKLWTMKLTYTGTAKGALAVKGSITANSPADPVAKNDSATTKTKYAS